MSVGGIRATFSLTVPSHAPTTIDFDFNSIRKMIKTVLTKRKKKMAKFLVEEAMRRGSSDNICVIVLWLKE